MKIEFNGTIEEYKKFLDEEIKRIKHLEDKNEYIDLGLSSGTLWAKCNTGASSEDEYGDYINFNEANSKYDLPTKEQFEELAEECQWKWCSVNEHNGYLIIGKNGNSIFLPAAGYINSMSEALSYGNISGCYWSCSPYGVSYGHLLSFGSKYVVPSNDYYRATRFSVRTIKYF